LLTYVPFTHCVLTSLFRANIGRWFVA
jgi:hypothetical protein